MGNRIDTRVVLGSLRYKSAPDTTLGFKVPFIQTFKENVEFDRSINISLEQVYDDERQVSTTFRPTGKFTLLFKNSYSGFTNYTPFENNLYYLNEEAATISQCQTSPQTVSWTGLPQYNEFDFVRTDYNIVGYTQPPNNHITFISKSASTYNWNFFMSYAYENDYNKYMEAIEPKSGQLLQWTCGDGIPFVVFNTTYKGLDIVALRCPVKHGMLVGEFVKLSFNYFGTDTFQVYSLGDGASGSDEYVVNIINVGFLGGTFSNGVEGTFKRIIDINNPNDTTSEYYVRKHKILTNSGDAVMVNAGFDLNIFGDSKKYESSGYTPNQTARVSIKEGSQCYTLTFNTDINISPLLDNQKRPITELFFTTMWKGYFGLMFGRKKSNGVDYIGLKQGYEFNLPLIGSQPSPWWDGFNSDSDTPFPVDVYNTNMGNTGGPNGGPIPFTYIRSLKKDDVLDGDFCEWNDSEQYERVVSNLFHKFTFNRYMFSMDQVPTTNPFGYYYQPHTPIKLRVYSDYIESGDKRFVADVPDYSYFSEKDNQFIWRDIYPYGFIDSSGLGITYPFMNGTHYPYQDIIFRIIPEGTNYKEQILINDPVIDPCE